LFFFFFFFFCRFMASGALNLSSSYQAKDDVRLDHDAVWEWLLASIRLGLPRAARVRVARLLCPVCRSAEFCFGDEASRFIGLWHNQRMMRASFFHRGRQIGNALYETDGGSNALLPDPYEAIYVYVAQSTLPNAGLGLFARVSLPCNFVASFYAGQPIDLQVFKVATRLSSFSRLPPRKCILDRGKKILT
jgi:hypothetical protein